jgi:hypothetical protein
MAGLTMWALVGASPTVLAQDSAVRVTAARANIRAEASETSPVLTQVTSGTVLELLATEGEWFHVRVAVGTIRIDAYISKKVAALAPPPASAARGAAPPSALGGRSESPAPTPAAAADPAVANSRDGMSVALVAGESTNWMSPGTVRVLRARDKVDSLARLAASMPSPNDVPASADGSAQVTYVWAVDGKAANRVLDTRRPSFVVMFKDVPGVGPDDLMPLIVRLTPTASDARIFGAARGRADEASRDDADWDVMKELKQDVVRANTETLGRGTVRLQPAGDLAPGEYAVVLRPTNAKRKLAGRSVLGNQAEGHAFGLVWEFAIR